MESGSPQRETVERLAEEFVERYRRGERPPLSEYADRYPDHAEQIRELFPALIMMERIAPGSESDYRPGFEPVPHRRPGEHPEQIGDYRILREIGHGGMGVVYEAEQISLGRRVALKVLPGHVVGDRKALQRFRREAKAGARLHHTNIVPVFEVGRDGEIAFYAMQFIQGEGLDQVIDELGRLRSRDGESAGTDQGGRGRPVRRAVGTETARAAAAGPRIRELGRMAESLLSGRLGSEGLRAFTDPARPATEAAGTEPFDPYAATDAEERDAGRHPRETPPAADGGTSALLPGGTAISSVDSSVRRQPFYRSVAQIGRQAAQGLAHAHSRGVVHRDIKPSNLLLDTAGVVWITDFGLAKAEDDGLTATGELLGTLRYMAPERFRGEGDARADIYALGLTLYELLTLEPAHHSSDRLELIERIKTEEPARPRSRDGRIPRDLETIVLKASDKLPERRYASADAMAEDLRRFLADEPIRARQVGAAERYWRWARRNPAIAVLGLVLTAVLIATTAGSMVAATYFRGLNQKSQEAEKAAVEARRQALLERDHSRQQSADLALDKGIALAREGHADRGLLWMLEALKTAPEDAEGFRRMVRWNLGAWLGQVHKPLRIIDIGGPCSDLALSPDGRSFATGYLSGDRSRATPIDLWDTDSGRKLSSFPGASAPFAFSPDGRALVATADNRRCMVAIDLATERVLWTSPQLPGDSGWPLSISPDGSMVLAPPGDQSGNVSLLRLDAATGQPRGEPMRGRGYMAVAPDGRTVATGRIEDGEGYIDVLELPSGRRTASCRASLPHVYRLLFSPDGNSLYGSASGDARGFDPNIMVAQIWDSGTGRPTSSQMAGTSDAIYTPSSDRLVTPGENRQLVRDAASGRVRGSGFLAERPFTSHPDGRTMLAGTSDNLVRSWQISADAEPVSDAGTDKQASMAGRAPERNTWGLLFVSGLRADGQIAISLAKDSVGRELIRLTDLATGRPMGRPAPHHPGWIVRTLALSRDGRCFATGSNPDGRFAGEVRLWDASTGRLRIPPMLHTNYVSALAFQPDGKVLAAGDFDGLVRLWDTSTGREIGRPLPQGEIVMSLAYSPDGKTLAVGLANDQTGKPGTRLWDTTTRQPIGEFLPSTARVTRVEFRPDGGTLLAGSENRSTRLWDTTRGIAIGEPMMDERAGGFRPDGRAFLTLGGDGSVKVRDATTGEALARLLTSSSPATCAAFRDDGGLVAAGFDDGVVRLCDPATNQPVGPPRSMRHAVHRVAFTSDGRSVAAIDEVGESRTWPVPEPLLDPSLDDLALRIEARTGLRMETGLSISRLDGPAWRDRLELLGRLDPAADQRDDGPAWHEPMIREAEAVGNGFAAIWHLDRLIAARPDDWSLHARRARAWSRSDRFDRADADYRQAERLGSREEVLDFQTQCVIDCARAGRWAEDLWYLDRLIAARPDDGTLHEARATAYGKLGREADRRVELARVFELGADEGLVIPRAEELGRDGRWAEAAALLARCGRIGPLSRELAQAWGIACLEAGDRVGYREACAAVVARHWPNPTGAWDAHHVASLLALGSQGLDDYRAPIDWFERRLADGPVPPPVCRPYYFPNALGGLLLRAGRIDEAIVRLDEGTAAAKGTKLEEFPTDWAYLSLAHARMGNFAEGRRWLGRLRAWRPISSTSFWDLQELALLRTEAESLLFDAEFPSDPFQGPQPR